MRNQHTIRQPISVQGIGIHLGQPAVVTLRPAAANSGRFFYTQGVKIPALSPYTRPSLRCTALAKHNHIIHTPEHLLAALQGLAIDNLEIEINGPEIPILDGSAKGWVAAILQAGIQQQKQPAVCFRPTAPLFFTASSSWLRISPAEHPKLTLHIDFPHPQIGKQTASFQLVTRKGAHLDSPVAGPGILI